MQAYGWLVAGGCLSVSLPVGLAALTAQRVLGTACGVAVFFIGAVWLGLSPSAQIPYTDSCGMFWPTLTLYLYICVDSPRVKWPLIVAASVLGFFVKAPTMAVLGAIVVVEVCLRVRDGAAGNAVWPSWREGVRILAYCVAAGFSRSASRRWREGFLMWYLTLIGR